MLWPPPGRRASGPAEPEELQGPVIGMQSLGRRPRDLKALEEQRFLLAGGDRAELADVIAKDNGEIRRHWEKDAGVGRSGEHLEVRRSWA